MKVLKLKLIGMVRLMPLIVQCITKKYTNMDIFKPSKTFMN